MWLQEIQNLKVTNQNRYLAEYKISINNITNFLCFRGIFNIWGNLQG